MKRFPPGVLAGFLPKPWAPAELAAKVRQALATPAVPAASAAALDAG
jgi:hypothetical protein